jgi:hypothetical protein
MGDALPIVLTIAVFVWLTQPKQRRRLLYGLAATTPWGIPLLLIAQIVRTATRSKNGRQGA